MDKVKQELQGSEKRDIFRRKHKKLSGKFYASDVDFVLISKHPPGVVAYLDYKTSYDHISFCEALLYNKFLKDAPVYIVEGNDPENGPFVITRYIGGNWKPEPPVIEWGEKIHISNWHAFGIWEGKLRSEYEERKGWSGNLKGVK